MRDNVCQYNSFSCLVPATTSARRPRAVTPVASTAHVDFSTTKSIKVSSSSKISNTQKTTFEGRNALPVIRMIINVIVLYY